MPFKEKSQKSALTIQSSTSHGRVPLKRSVIYVVDAAKTKGFTGIIKTRLRRGIRRVQLEGCKRRATKSGMQMQGLGDVETQKAQNGRVKIPAINSPRM
jgi:hypothetical protein